MPLWRMEMIYENNKPYHPSFDVLLDALSNNDEGAKEKIEKYVVHRKRFGKHAAARIYPEVHHIVIVDPMLKGIWNDILKIMDKL